MNPTPAPSAIDDPGLLSTLRQALQRRAEELERDLAAARERRRSDSLSLTGTVVDRKDLAESQTEGALDASEEERERVELGAVNAALARLDRGGYGLCSDCGVAIPAARLLAMPQASRCAPCQQAAENTPDARP